ncbi:zinc finger Ran-binding domain-containing protein 2-like isoform X2 [Phalaenopsis equestris]|uniref:zinc finger Ran-binding domain-containing protein 2-like isoform X2 n=1 Tax=Phalaenopsis equestris TaxID=78828 RepID=UPI0009E5A489|nr:zinc finger Ran-binding domain-containing protein 2-like isoform X2 [Phalaenopsis equestris]
MNRKAGDWNCRSCQHLNFSRRDSCHRCGEPRLGGGEFAGGLINTGARPPGAVDVKPGDWYCACGVHNFASRSSCFKCGGLKDDGVTIAAGTQVFGYGCSPLPGWKSGDWICTRYGCNEHNFASRLECYRCNAPREYNGM